MIKKILTGFVIVIVLIIGTVFYLINDFKKSNQPYNPENETEIIFSINEGDRARSVAINLQSKGLIKNSDYFLISLYLNKKENKLLSGEYILKPSMDTKTIIETITSANAVAKKITIIEGWTLKDIGEKLASMDIASTDDFYSIAGTPAKDYRLSNDILIDFSPEFNFLNDKPKGISLEGYLYPDTYYLPINATSELIMKKALLNFNKKLTPEMREEISSQGKTIFEIVTMASILEKEVRGMEDKKMVAGILYKRQKLRMPLQADATIVYAMIHENNPKINTKYDSPYNTYIVNGLPLGPICNPGIESIEAAIYPIESDDLFYLSAKKDGKTIFSKTYEEHKRAIRNHLY